MVGETLYCSDRINHIHHIHQVVNVVNPYHPATKSRGCAEVLDEFISSPPMLTT